MLSFGAWYPTAPKNYFSQDPIYYGILWVYIKPTLRARFHPFSWFNPPPYVSSQNWRQERRRWCIGGRFCCVESVWNLGVLVSKTNKIQPTKTMAGTEVRTGAISPPCEGDLFHFTWASGYLHIVETLAGYWNGCSDASVLSPAPNRLFNFLFSKSLLTLTYTN